MIFTETLPNSQFMYHRQGVKRLHLPLQRGDRLLSTEYDVCRRQILTTKVYPRTVRVKYF